MAITVEALQLTVESSAKPAADSVGKLVEQLKELRTILEKNFKFKIDIGNDFAKAMSSATTSGLRKAKAEINKGLKREVIEPWQKMFGKALNETNRGSVPTLKKVNSSYHTAGNVTKKDSAALARALAKEYGIDTKSYSYKKMTSDITDARSGMGRYGGDFNSAWATEKAFNAMISLAQNIRETAHPGGNGDTIDMVKEAASGLRLAANDISELKKMNMTPSSLRAALAPMGIKVYDQNSTNGLRLEEMQTYGYGHDSLASALSGVNGIMDFYEKLSNVWNSRNKNALSDPSMSMKHVLDDVMTRLMDDVRVRGEKAVVDPDAEKLYKSTYDEWKNSEIARIKAEESERVKADINSVSSVDDIRAMRQAMQDLVDSARAGLEVFEAKKNAEIAEATAVKEATKAVQDHAVASSAYTKTIKPIPVPEFRDINKYSDWFAVKDQVSKYNRNFWDRDVWEQKLIDTANEQWNAKTGGYGGLQATNIEDASEMIAGLKQISEETTAAISQMFETLNTPVTVNLASAIDQKLGIGAEVKSAEDSMSAFMQLMQDESPMANDIRALNPELQEFCQKAMDSGVKAENLTADMAGLDGEFKQKKKDAADASEGIRKVGDAARESSNKTKHASAGLSAFKKSLSNTGTSIKGFIRDHTLLGKAFTKVGNLFGQFVRVAKMRAMRYAIRAMVQGLKEGISNMYQWSKATKGSFSKSMDEASTALLYMKNSIATAVAPVIQALIPVLQKVVGWINQACNWLAQFFALLRGQSTWTKAVEYATEYAAATKKGSDNTKEMLAAFDELNVIQSESGSGSSSKTPDYSGMFTTETEFDPSILPWVEKAREALDWIKQTASDIWDIVWPAVQKLAPVIMDAISELMPIIKEAVQILTPIVEKIINMAVDFIKEAWPTLKEALKWIGDNLDWILPTVLAIKVGLGGWKIASGLLGSSGLGGVHDKISGISTIAKKLAGIGLISIGVKLGLDFGKDIVDSINSGKPLSKESIMKGVGGAIASAIGGTLLIGGPYGWAIGLGVYIIANAIPVVEDILSKIHPVEEDPDYGKVIDPIHVAADGTEEGAGVDWFIEKYDKLGKHAKQAATVMGQLKDKAYFSLGTINETLTNLYDNLALEDLIPLIDSVGFEKSLDAMYDAAVKFGKDTTTVIRNWKFIAPFVNEDNYSESLATIRNLSRSTGADVETIMQHWKFIAPMINKYGYDESLGMIESLAITCGASTKDIIGHWAYMAPAIDKYGFDKSLEIVTMLAIYSGKDIKEIIAHWDIIAPYIDDENIDESIETISDMILEGGDNWVRDLHSKKLTTNKIEVPDSDVPGQIQKQVDAGKFWANKAENIIKIYTSVKEEASNKLNKIISTVQTYFNNNQPKIKIDADTTKADNTIANWNPFGGKSKTISLLPVLGSSSSSSSSSGSSSYSSFDTSNLATSSAVSNVYNAVINSRNTLKQHITDTGLDILDSLKNSAATTYETKWNSDGSVDIAPCLASGAYSIPKNGQLFISREAGPELVGQIGSHNTVANNDQIVRGIEGGVENANREQNMLLSQLIAIGTAILEKDNSVRLTPSAALGRVNAQSAAMYDRAGGR